MDSAGQDLTRQLVRMHVHRGNEQRLALRQVIQNQANDYSKHVRQ